jgi:Na+/phosphate symporter
MATLISHQTTQKGFVMFFIGILFLGLWIAGEATANTLGGFIHVFLILALTVLLSQTIRGHRGSRLAELNNSPDPIDSRR